MRPSDITTPLQLYKYLMRSCEKLPGRPQRIHYKNHVRREFAAYADETDPQRINEIIKRSVTDCDWILNKYIK